MGSIEKEEMSMVGCGVGSIVWVRRRNGSWWPGKILGAAELSAANLVSPRSGTPVKLLGREDASVDWYNLEKSKRVKPFRCGEFDECIERAESAFGMPPKKREKYARREDAILHALEIEKQLRDDKDGSLDSPIDGRRNKSSVMVKMEPAVSSKCSKYSKTFKPRSKNIVVATKNVEVNDPIGPQEVNKVSLMRVSLNEKSELDNFESGFPISGLINNKATGIGGSLEKTRNLTNVNEPLLKRRDRRRSVVQVLQKSEKEHKEPTSRTKMGDFSLPSESNDCSDEEKFIGLIPKADSSFDMDVDGFPRPTEMDEESSPDESTENTETDSSKTQSDEDADMAGLAEAAFVPKLEAKPQDISEQFQRRSLSIELPNDSDMSPFYLNNHGPASLGVSKWQIKGKRNKRRITKRSTDATDRWVTRGSMYTTRGSMYTTDLEDIESDGFDGNVERGFRTQKRSYCNQRSLYNPNIINEHPWMRGYWEDSRDHIDRTFDTHRYGERMEIGLLDVDLNVQSSYQRGEHVPLISLRSKLNGKAIVGHPIQVEILENGFTNSLLSSSNGWRMPFKKSKKYIPDGIISKKPSKNVGSSSYQKIKNLSAIEREQTVSNNFRSGDKSSFRAGGLIKGVVGPTTVACIPVKLAFCRLNEGLVGRHQ